MLRNLLLSLAALVLLAAMVVTSTTPPMSGYGAYISAALGGDGGTIIAPAERIKVAVSENDDPSMEEKQQLVMAASAIGSLYFCDKAGLYTAMDRTAALYMVGWTRMTDIFAPYEQFPGSSMFDGAMYISQITHETAINGFLMKQNEKGEYEPVMIDSAEVCMEAEAMLRTLMQEGKVLDGKWRVGQRGA